MLIGVPKEIKTHEYRVGLTPASVREVVRQGHGALVQKGAGETIGLGDDVYRAAGAEIVEAASEIWARADMIVKVKEPQPSEYGAIRRGQILFTYLHLAPDPEQTRALIASGAVAIAYETVTDAAGGLPLLKPMSEVAGRMAVQAGANCLEIERGGRGMLLGGVPGVQPAKVVVLGGGVVGSNAARMALGLGADVTVIDRSVARLEELDRFWGPALKTLYATYDAIEEQVLAADLVIGAVLVAGAAAPRLVGRETVARMKRGAVLVDVAIDQGGCFATSRPTTHADPTYMVDGVIHYCVANMPGAVARTSTFALNNATLPFVLALANRGYRQALIADPHLRNGLNVCAGQVTCEPVAREMKLDYVPAEKLLA